VAETRRDQAVAAALALLEQHGEAAVTMRAIAERVGVKAPSLYKHFPDKADLETALVAEGLRGMGEAVAAAPAGLAGLAAAYRSWAVAHPHLYVLATGKPIDRERLPPGVEDNAAAPVLAAAGGDEHRARAVWAAAHGLVSLELAGRFPPHADIDAAWAELVAAFE
jgi:AcrR family transcriptional regulator